MLRLATLLYFAGIYAALTAFPAKAGTSIASSLTGYQAAIAIKQISGISDANISGVTFNPNTKTLFVVDNLSCSIYELSPSGVLLRTIKTAGFDDLEGIAFQTGYFYFVSEEQRGNVDRIEIPLTGAGPLQQTSASVFNIGTGFGNNGIEGVSYCTSNATVYAVKERVPPRLYRIILDTTGKPASLYANDPFNIENKSGDAADIFALADGNFLLVDQEENKLVGYSHDGVVLSELSLSMMTQPEGIALDTLNNTIYIVGEPRQLFSFKSKTTAIASTADPTHQIKVFTQRNGLKTRIMISPAATLPVSLEVYSLFGQKIKELGKTVIAGTHEINTEMTSGKTGLLLCRIKTGTFSQTIKMAKF